MSAADPAPPPRVLTVTVSDTRTAADDASGRAMAGALAGASSPIVHVAHRIVPDETDALLALVRAAMEGDEADALVFSGGTGIAPRDRTHEALEALFDKHLDGFGEAFRRLSFDEIGPRAILSRATAGTVGTRIVFSLPGSEKAVILGMRELVVPVLAHAVDLLHGRTGHPHSRSASAPAPAEPK